jgi:beta-mannosidase
MRSLFAPVLLGLLSAGISWCGQMWTARLEEPTGLYRRHAEVVRIPLPARGALVVADAVGQVVASQISGAELLFEASVVPGQTPAYNVFCCAAAQSASFDRGLYARPVGLRRVEFGNKFFRMVLDGPKIVEAYGIEAGDGRVVNLVETTPETADPADLHRDSFRPLPAVPGVEGPNDGWSGGDGAVEIVESGPLQGRIRIGEQELTWTSGGRWLRWRSPSGFRFTAVSAAPFLPFDRFVDTPESELWPDVSSTEEPPSHEVVPRGALRGGHGVYYQLGDNYGALGIVDLSGVRWTGIGSRRFTGSSGEIAITFPKWAGFRTLLEARRENRIVRQPLLARVSGPVPSNLPLARRPRAPRPPAHIGSRLPRELPLDGNWEIAWCDKGCEQPKSGWRETQVPGTAHIQWLGREKAMTREAEWVSGKEWWYRKRVRIPPGFSGKRIRIRFEATDYYADTWVNGRFAGRHEGYVDPYEYDITAYLTAETEIVVRTWTPVTYYWRHRPYTIKGSYGAVDQKPDDITAVGITRSVKLIAEDGPAIRDIAVNTRLRGPAADVEVDIDADGHCEVTLTPRNFQSAERYRASGPCGRLTLPVDKPRLWWTWDHGRPNLYTLQVTVLDKTGSATDKRSLAVGIREIEKIGWQFYLNRRRMFIRGTNYYANLFLSEMDRGAYERDVKLMLGMNVNAIRLHCHFSNPEFYDLADESGVLVWQDFLEAWYPEDTEFSLHAARLYNNHIRYVRNHPSVALWATSDEDSLENYRDLTKHLAARAALLDPQRRPVVRSTGRYGDSHVYNGWYGGSIWEYATMTDMFVSELGATSLPNYETLIQFLPNHWPIHEHEAEWKWRKLQIPQAMRAWGEPGSMTLREYIPKTQAYTSRLFQIALERARRRKSEGVGGILHFHAIDMWPSITMAAIDVNRIPTKTYFTVRRSFAPVLASIEYDRDRWRSGDTVRVALWAVNDTWNAIPGASIEWRVGTQGGSFEAGMEADSSREVGRVEWKAAGSGRHELRARVVDASGAVLSENVFEFEVVP